MESGWASHSRSRYSGREGGSKCTRESEREHERERKRELGTGVTDGGDEAEVEEGLAARTRTRDSKLRARAVGGGKLASFEIILHDVGE